jgi:hypothetical protein
MAKKTRNGFYIAIDNQIKSLTHLADAAYYISSAEANRSAKIVRDIMIKDIKDKSQGQNDYALTREDRGITANYYHKDRGGDYDSVTKAIVTFPNKSATANPQYTVGVGASKGPHSVQNAGMSASMALALVDKGFQSSEAITFPLTKGREKIADEWSVTSVRPKNFIATGISAGNREMKKLESAATVIMTKQFNTTYGGKAIDTEYVNKIAKNYYLSVSRELEDDGEE